MGHSYGTTVTRKLTNVMSVGERLLENCEIYHIIPLKISPITKHIPAINYRLIIMVEVFTTLMASPSQVMAKSRMAKC